jgi:hypothetical protein
MFFYMKRKHQLQNKYEIINYNVNMSSTYFTNEVLPEFMKYTSEKKEKEFSRKRQQIVAERGACVLRPFACNNCYEVGFPCTSCYACVWGNKEFKKMKPEMYTCMRNPRDDLSFVRKMYIHNLYCRFIV